MNTEYTYQQANSIQKLTENTILSSHKNQTIRFKTDFK